MVRRKFNVNTSGIITRGCFGSTHGALGRISFGTRKAPWLQPFSGIGRDLVLLASSVRQVDRLAPRSDARRPSAWGRSLELRVPVSKPHRWSEVHEQLEELLNWLTDDSWRLAFESSADAPAVQQQLFDERPVREAQSVALFSGGLDSAAGADAWLKSGSATYLFSVSGDNVHAKYARQGAEFIQAKHPGRTSLIAATHQLRQGKAADDTQRTRGFFFLALAAAAAHALDIRRVLTFEAGVGALNLPMNRAQTGADNTRAMHPRTLLLCQSVFSKLFESEFRVDAPFLLKTKGEVCQATGADIREIALASYSCDTPQGRRPKPFQHCGVCTSCLFRRSALFRALRQKDPTDYARDPRTLDDAYELDAFREQAVLFSAWRQSSEILAYAPHARWAPEYLKTGFRGAERELVSLFNRHGAEVSAFLRGGRQARQRTRRPTEAHRAVR